MMGRRLNGLTLSLLSFGMMAGCGFATANEAGGTADAIQQGTTAPALGAAMTAERRGVPSSDIRSREGADAGKPAISHHDNPWLTVTGLSANARDLIRDIENAGAHGLNPSDYGLKRIRHLLGQLAAAKNTDDDTVSGLKHEVYRLQLAGALDKAFTRYVRHLGQGVIDGKSVQNRLFRDAPPVYPEKLRDALARGVMTFNEIIASVAPSSGDYQRLTRAMETLLEEKRRGRPRTWVGSLGGFEKGRPHATVVHAKLRLIETGDLPRSTRVDKHQDRAFIKALMQFQTRNGLVADGLLGANTRAALNRSVDEDIRRVALSLERWRWLPRELGKLHVRVNIPDYRVAVYNNGQRLMDMRTVVGSRRHQTPAFSRDLSYMEINPTWTVPASITNEELVPLERRRPGYLARDRFVALAGGRAIPVSKLPRSVFDKKPFPYTLRQPGGPDNVLGRMKFMMPNPYAIYLHDTQAKRLFDEHDRAYSHGCIRLSDPEYFARLLLRIDGQDETALHSALASGKTTRISLRKPIATHLYYLTTWVDEAGITQYRNDVYGQDPGLERALVANNTLLSVLDDYGKDYPSGTMTTEALLAAN